MEKIFDFLSHSKHTNGSPIAEVYRRSGSAKTDNQGPIVTFNLLRQDGSFIGYSEVEKMCDLFDIQLRTGCFCNQGACQQYLKLSNEELQFNYKMEGKVCGDAVDVINGKPVGAVRVSLGRQSTDEDILQFIKMVETCFMTTALTINDAVLTYPSKITNSQCAYLMSMYVYPIKSCSPYEMKMCKITNNGLAYDRSWAIISSRSVVMTQHKLPQLCRITPEINNERLHITSPYSGSRLIVQLNSTVPTLHSEYKVCGTKLKGKDCGDEAAKWISSVLNGDYRLLNQVHYSESGMLASTNGFRENFVNSSQYLLINRQSVVCISTLVDRSAAEIIKRFRANFVVDGLEAFIEDRATHLSIGDIDFEITEKCVRCQMICIDQESGNKESDLLIALSNFRDRQKITFGVYLRHREGSDDMIIGVGERVQLFFD